MFLCLEHARLIWIRSANSHTGPQLMLLHYEAGQMAASDLRAIIPKLPLAFVGASTEEHLAQLSVRACAIRACSVFDVWLRACDAAIADTRW
jgi:hypothetical protein